MNNKISTKRFVLVLKDSSKFFLDDKEAGLVRNAIKQGLDYLEVGESLISRWDFSRLVSSVNYEEAERKRQGQWQCFDCKRWHPFKEKCGCMGGRY
uniref:Uncharacterized protein n=1 Tax=viral metagenome TaxID=1070528 RepID=A0A6H1ZFQ5_9ZZZZ